MHVPQRSQPQSSAQARGEHYGQRRVALLPMKRAAYEARCETPAREFAWRKHASNGWLVCAVAGWEPGPARHSGLLCGAAIPLVGAATPPPAGRCRLRQRMPKKSQIWSMTLMT